MVSPLLKSKNIILSKGQMLKEAEKKIAAMEVEARKGMEHIRQQTWQIAQLRMAVTALCMKFNVSTEQCKEIYDAYCAEEDKKLLEHQQKLLDEAKAKFAQDIKDGKKVEFQSFERDKQ